MPSPNSYALIEIKHAEPAGMSRLGQNRTLWGQAPMSALPPKAEIDLELYPSEPVLPSCAPILWPKQSGGISHYVPSRRSWRGMVISMNVKSRSGAGYSSVDLSWREPVRSLRL